LTHASDEGLRLLRQRHRQGKSIPREWVAQAMQKDDLYSQCLSFEILAHAFPRIVPPMDVGSAREFFLQYYLRCIGANVTPAAASESDEPHSPYEAARELALLLAWALQAEADGQFAVRIGTAVAELYDKGGEDTQTCIETGFLEHALEYCEARPFFGSWASDLGRREAYLRALQWGEAHERALPATSPFNL